MTTRVAIINPLNRAATATLNLRDLSDVSLGPPKVLTLMPGEMRLASLDELRGESLDSERFEGILRIQGEPGLSNRIVWTARLPRTRRQGGAVHRSSIAGIGVAAWPRRLSELLSMDGGSPRSSFSSMIPGWLRLSTSVSFQPPASRCRSHCMGSNFRVPLITWTPIGAAD